MQRLPNYTQFIKEKRLTRNTNFFHYPFLFSVWSSGLQLHKTIQEGNVSIKYLLTTIVTGYYSKHPLSQDIIVGILWPSKWSFCGPTKSRVCIFCWSPSSGACSCSNQNILIFPSLAVKKRELKREAFHL